MKTRTLKELLLYNYRYWFGYSIIIGFIVYFLGWQIGTLPGGLSQPEINTAASRADLQSILQQPLYPLHAILQWGSMNIFGSDPWALRLASVLIGLVVALALYNLLKRWFGKPTALLSTAVFISADWFLFIARLGTGAVEFSLWLSLALLCLTKLLERKTNWLILFTLSLCGLLFAPFGIYAVITLVISLFACRLFRERIMSASLVVKILSPLILLLTITGIGFISFNNFDFLKSLLGIQALPSITEYVRNVFNNLGGVVAVLPSSNVIISPSGIFFIRFFEFILILFGVIMFWRTRVNRLNLVVLILSLVLALASGLSAGSRANGLILIPAAIFMTAGVRHLLHRWQRTFPLNPYARVTAYATLTVLFICVVALHYVSYFELWQTQSTARATFQPDFMLLKNELKKTEYSNKKCFVDSSNETLNKLLEASDTQCELQFKNQSTPPDYIIRTPSESTLESLSRQNPKVLTSETTTNNVRWLIVNNQSNN